MIITISKFHQSTYSNTDEDKWTDLKLCLFYSRKDTCDLTVEEVNFAVKTHGG